MPRKGLGALRRGDDETSPKGVRKGMKGKGEKSKLTFKDNFPSRPVLKLNLSSAPSSDGSSVTGQVEDLADEDARVDFPTHGPWKRECDWDPISLLGKLELVDTLLLDGLEVGSHHFGRLRVDGREIGSGGWWNVLGLGGVTGERELIEQVGGVRLNRLANRARGRGAFGSGHGG